MFLFFSRTRCPTEIVSSQSNTYSYWSLSDDRCLFAALYHYTIQSLTPRKRYAQKAHGCSTEGYCIIDQKYFSAK